MRSPTLVILAAGIGSRYGGLKQLDAVGPNGEPVMVYSIRDAVAAGFGKVVFVVRPEIESPLRERIGRFIDKGIETAYVHQRMDALPAGFAAPASRSKPWGTCHALLCAAEAVAEPCMTINADDLYGPAAFQLLAKALTSGSQTGSEHFMVAFLLRNTLSEHGPVSRGVCRVSKDGKLLDVTERRKIAKREGRVCFEADGGWQEIADDAPVSLNLWGFMPGIFPMLREKFAQFLSQSASDPNAEFGIPQTIDALLKEGRISVKVLRSPDKWHGMSYKEDLAGVRAAVRTVE